jgi:hypothetical protein
MEKSSKVSISKAKQKKQQRDRQRRSQHNLKRVKTFVVQGFIARADLAREAVGNSEVC